ALADLVARTHATKKLAEIDNVWRKLAGQREDVSLADLVKLRAQAGITSLKAPSVAAKLRDAIGDRFKRTVNVHPMPNVDHLPVIATLLGPRVHPDTVAIGSLTNGRGPDLQAAELGFVLGHDRALAYADKTLEKTFRTARDQLEHAKLGDDLYSAWLEGIRAL